MKDHSLFSWIAEIEETQEDGYYLEGGAWGWMKQPDNVFVQALMTGRWMRLYGHGQN